MVSKVIVNAEAEREAPRLRRIRRTDPEAEPATLMMSPPGRRAVPPPQRPRENPVFAGGKLARPANAVKADPLHPKP
jgi:hypothetical protein